METLAHGVAGSLGGALAMGALYPLDQIKTIMQVERQAALASEESETMDTAADADKSSESSEQQEAKPKAKQLANATASTSFWAQALAILKQQRWRVYQGHVSTQVALGGSNFVYFFCYNGLKSGLLKRLRAMDPVRYPSHSDAISPLQNLVLSCAAGIINVYATAPLWVVNMRLKSKDHAKYTGVVDCMRQIVASEGVRSLWNGTLASLILVSNPVIHYVSYERMKTAIQLRRQGAALSAWEIFLLGALAKSITTVITYPLQVAQSLMRVQQKAVVSTKGGEDATAKVAPPAVGVMGCLTQIYRNEGVPGLFAGLEAKLLQTVLTAAISLVTYEKLLAMILFFLQPSKRAPLAIKAQA